MIAFYMHDLSGGGVERMRLALIAELRARGERVCLIVNSSAGPMRSLVPPDLTLIDLKVSGMLRAVAPLANVLRQLKPKFLVASLDHNNITALLAGLSARTNTRIVICQHNALSAERDMGWRYRAVPWLYWLLQKSAARIIAVSYGVAGDLARTAGIAPARITTIYNPVIGRSRESNTHAEAPHPWLAPGGPQVCLFAGRLSEQKDPCLALRSFALLPRMRPAKLIMLGEGPLQPSLALLAEKLGIAEHVFFAGFQPNPLAWMERAACLLSTSRFEGLGNVLIEALACGTPVVATDCPYGPSEILDGGAFGELAPVGDAAALAACIRRTLDTPPDRELLRARAALFSAASCADAHLALFAGLHARCTAGKEESSFLKKRSRRLLLALSRTSGPARVFGLRFSALTAGEVADGVFETPAGVDLVVTPNLDHIRLLGQPAFGAAYRSAHTVCPDGFPVLAYARMRGLKLRRRVTGCEIYARLADDPRLRTKSMCVVVESPKTAASLRRWAARQNLAACHIVTAPPRLANDAAAQTTLAYAIAQAAPEILVMTLGAPVSEVFVHTHRALLPACWALCVGQAVRVHLGLVERAPATWQRLGLEWAWRIRQEPGRLAGRYARALAWFPVAVARDLAEKRLLTTSLATAE